MIIFICLNLFWKTRFNVELGIDTFQFKEAVMLIYYSVTWQPDMVNPGVLIRIRPVVLMGATYKQG